MDPLDKLELIVLGMKKQTKTKLDRSQANDGPHGDNPLYIVGLRHQVDTLSQVWTVIDAVRRNHHCEG
jgi:hypothetical protein